MKAFSSLIALIALVGITHAGPRITIETGRAALNCERPAPPAHAQARGHHRHASQDKGHCRHGRSYTACNACSAKGHWEHREIRYWVEARTERVWQPATIEWRYDSHRGWFKVEVAGGCYITRTIPGYWTTRTERVWVPNTRTLYSSRHR